MGSRTATAPCISENRGDSVVRIVNRRAMCYPRWLCRALVIGAVAQFAGPLVAQPLSAPAAEQVQGSAVAEAARQGDRQAVQTLLRQGLDVNGWGGDGTPALHWAV